MHSSTDPPRTPGEIERWAHGRQPHEREAIPQPGERVLLRRQDFGEAVPAVVAQVQDMVTPGDHWGPPTGTGQPDPNVWELDGETGAWRLKADPWPWVSVRPVATADDGTEHLGAAQWCKESRVRGSPGWLRPGTRAHHGRYTESGE